jgi:hypothetical protein
MLPVITLPSSATDTFRDFRRPVDHIPRVQVLHPACDAQRDYRQLGPVKRFAGVAEPLAEIIAAHKLAHEAVRGLQARTNERNNCKVAQSSAGLEFASKWFELFPGLRNCAQHFDRNNFLRRLHIAEVHRCESASSNYLLHRQIVVGNRKGLELTK